MFASMNRQRKAETLLIEGNEAMEAADGAYRKAIDRLEQIVTKLEDLRQHLAQKALPLFQERYEALTNAPAVELPPPPESSFKTQVGHLLERHQTVRPQPPHIGGGKTGALFSALLVAVALIVAALIAAAVGSGMPLHAETFTEPPKLMRLFEWLGGGAVKPAWANPFTGMAAVVLLALIGAFTTYSLKLGKRAKGHLQKAEEFKGAAQTYVKEKENQTLAVEHLADQTASFVRSMTVCEAYLDESNAILRRIILTEGENFDTFRPASQQAIKRAGECAAVGAALMHLTLIDTNGEPSEQLALFLQRAEGVADALFNETPLPQIPTIGTQERVSRAD